MKKKIKSSILLIVSLFCILCLTSCVFGNRASGTKPTIHGMFYTDNTAPDTYSDWSQLPNRNNYMSHGVPYCLVCAFSDPEKDANKLYLSTNSAFPADHTWYYNINQVYSDQISCWAGDTWTGPSGPVTLYAYMTDATGNRSDTFTFSLYFYN